MYTVYKHTSPNGKVYIGITSKDVKDRWDSGWGYEGNKEFSSDIKLYGWENIEHEILFSGLTKEKAIEKEIELISFYRNISKECCYNIQSGGERGYEMNEESRKRMSESHKGKKLSEETKKKLRTRYHGENHPFYGKHHTEEAKKRISETHKGRCKYWKGKTFSEEHRRKLSEAGKGVVHSKESIKKWKFSNKKIMTPVIQIDVETNLVIQFFDSSKEAERQTNIDSSSIIKCCRGKRKIAGSYMWRYATGNKIEIKNT